MRGSAWRRPGSIGKPSPSFSPTPGSGSRSSTRPKSKPLGVRAFCAPRPTGWMRGSLPSSARPCSPRPGWGPLGPRAPTACAHPASRCPAAHAYPGGQSARSGPRGCPRGHRTAPRLARGGNHGGDKSHCRAHRPRPGFAPQARTPRQYPRSGRAYHQHTARLLCRVHAL